MKHKRHFILLFLGLLGITNIRAQVINAGVGGNNTINLLKRLDTDVLQQNPDLLILMVGTNDMLNSRKMISYRTYGDNLKEIVQKTKEMGAKIILMSPPPADSTYLYQRHDRKLYAEIPNVKLDSARQIVAKAAKENRGSIIGKNYPAVLSQLILEHFQN